MCTGRSKKTKESSFEFEKKNLFSKTILDRIHKAVNEKINQSSFFRRYLFRLTYKIKVKRLEYGLDTPILNK
jgi:hypothetical protein